jgi:hypothetical protein
MAKTGVTTVTDKMKEVTKALRELQSQRVLVGIPSTKAQRNDGPISNAELGYIHENGAPEANIPARAFLVPGVKSVKIETAQGLKDAGKAALNGESGKMMQQLNRVGSVAASAVQKKITDGPFEPLKPSTVRSRMRKHKGRVDLNPKPLIDTGQLRRAITYVVRKTGK